MQWQVKKPVPAQEGDIRWVTRFALWPTLMSDGHTVVWLEFYRAKKAFTWVGMSYDGHYWWSTVERTPQEAVGNVD